MKRIIMTLSVSMASLSFISCNSNNSSKTTHAEAHNSSAKATNEIKPADAIITGYIDLKNSLAADNGNNAAKGGSEIMDALTKFDESKLTPEQKKVFDGLSADIKENSEHISVNGDNIAHQREHFEMLSKDIYDLAKSVGSGKTLYVDFCPMYNDNKGGTWLSETKEIKNPYFGKEMNTCGTVKEELK